MTMTTHPLHQIRYSSKITIVVHQHAFSAHPLPNGTLHLFMNKIGIVTTAVPTSKSVSMARLRLKDHDAGRLLPLIMSIGDAEDAQ